MCRTSLIISMGCINTKRDNCPTVFECVNIDDLGTELTAGQLEVTDSDIVFYPRGKLPIRWPLKTLRRYGYNAQQFSFETGRRSPTGPGVYAFLCRRAEELVHLLESRLQVRPHGEIDNGNVRIRRSSHSHNSIGSGGMLSPVASTNPIIGSLPIPPPPSRPLSQNVYANGEVIAAATSPSNSQDEANNNSVSDSTEHTYANTLLGGGDNDDANVAAPLYMNIVPGTASVPSEYHAQPQQQQLEMVPWEQEESPHNYANLDLESELELPKQTVPLPTEPTLNYIMLDLNQKEDAAPPSSPSSSIPPDSPKKTPLGYAVIDFDKTTALSHSVSSALDDSDCSRKTRHNSTQMPNGNSSLSA